MTAEPAYPLPVDHPPRLLAHGPFEFVPTATVTLQPDGLVARRPVARKRLVEAPLLAVEVLSRSTRSFEQSAKQETYAKSGVEHYWILDPRGPSIRTLRLPDGEYVRQAEAAAGTVLEVDDPVPVGFDPADLLDDE